MGNGGSAMTALHFITDWNKGVFSVTGRPFRGRSLSDNMGAHGLGQRRVYDDVFAEQLRNIATPGDVLIVLSGSGNSPNVVQGARGRQREACDTFAILGFCGGRLQERWREHAVHFPVDDMQIAEDLQRCSATSACSG